MTTNPTTQAAPKAPPKPDLDVLERLVRVMADYPTVNADMLRRLEIEEGMKFHETSQGRTYAKAGRLEVGARGSRDLAATNWGNAARRLLRQEGRAV